MSESLDPSPGLALGEATPPVKEKRRPGAPRTRERSVKLATTINKMSLADRAAALKKRKKPAYRLFLKLDEETYGRVIDLAERVSCKLEDAAVRCLQDGLRRYDGLGYEDELATVLPTPGERVAGLFDVGPGERTAVNDNPGGMKALMRQIGVQTT